MFCVGVHYESLLNGNHTFRDVTLTPAMSATHTLWVKQQNYTCCESRFVLNAEIRSRYNVCCGFEWLLRLYDCCFSLGCSFVFVSENINCTDKTSHKSSLNSLNKQQQMLKNSPWIETWVDLFSLRKLKLKYIIILRSICLHFHLNLSEWMPKPVTFEAPKHWSFNKFRKFDSSILSIGPWA